jgi:hypothetical protein
MSPVLLPRRVGLAIFLLSLAFLSATTVFGNTPPVVTVDVVRDGTDLIVSTTSHMPAIKQVSLETTASGELFTIAAPAMSLQLPLEVPVTLRVPIHLTAKGIFGTVAIRLTSSTLGTVKVIEFAFVRTNGTMRAVNHTEYAATVASILDDRDAAAVEERAGRLIQEAVAHGKLPAATTEDVPAGPGRPVPNSNFEKAWNRLVTKYYTQKAATATRHVIATSLHPRSLSCGPYIESPDNRDFPVQGAITYDNNSIGFNRPLQNPGYLGFVTTTVAFENDCFVQYRVRAFDYTTSWGGAFAVTVRTIDDPSYRDPILYLSTTAPDAGERRCSPTCISAINTVQQLLYPPDDRFQFTSGTIQLRPHYDQNNGPSRYLFHWNDEIKTLQQDWAWSGIPSSYTPFIAGHDSNLIQTANFYQVPPGIILFSDDHVWTIRWSVAHECGHFLQFMLQGGQLGDGQQHSVCQAIDIGPGFREGFADWHASYWETDGRILFMPCDGGECYSNCGANGYRIELNVAAFFWDVFDYTNHPAFDQNSDTVSYPLTLLLNWAARDYTSFDDFYTDFRDRGLWGASEPVTATLRGVNGVTSP